MIKYEIWNYAANLHYDFSDRDYNLLYVKAGEAGRAEMKSEYNSLEEAQNEINRYPDYYKTAIDSTGEVSAYALVKAEYDSDGEFIQSDIIEWH
jgi:hypothetical protein